MNLPGNYRACLCPCHFGNPTELPALRLESGLFTVPSTFPMWGEICSSLRYGTKSTPRAWIAPHPSGNILAAVGFSRESNYGTIERHCTKRLRALVVAHDGELIFRTSRLASAGTPTRTIQPHPFPTPCKIFNWLTAASGDKSRPHRLRCRCH